jgi:hypothetical protein
MIKTDNIKKDVIKKDTIKIKPEFKTTIKKINPKQ